jgi:hypothetical protein
MGGVIEDIVAGGGEWGGGGIGTQIYLLLHPGGFEPQIYLRLNPLPIFYLRRRCRWHPRRRGAHRQWREAPSAF